MSPSFFERLTGGLRASDEAEEPAFERSTVLRTGKSAKGGKLAVEPKFSPVSPAADAGQELDERGLEGEDQSGEEGQLTVDIYDDGSSIVVQSSVAGCRPEDLDISLEDNMLTIRGTRSRAHEVGGGNFYYRELYWGSFSRSIILPEEVDFSKADAAIRNGLLTVRLPKKDRGAKKLKVKVGE